MKELFVERLRVVYNPGEPTELIALASCSLHVGAGDPLVVVGPNGSGKTTLLRVIAGRIAAQAGELCVRVGDDIIKPSREWLRRNVEYIRQKPLDGLFADLTLAEHVALRAERKAISVWDPYGTSAGFESEERRLIELMPKYDRYRHRRVMELSGGEQQLFALALAQHGRSHIVALDEPTASLDRKVVAGAEQQLRQWLLTNTLCVIVSHDPGLAMRLGFRQVEMAECDIRAGLSL